VSEAKSEISRKQAKNASLVGKDFVRDDCDTRILCVEGRVGKHELIIYQNSRPEKNASRLTNEQKC